MPKKYEKDYDHRGRATEENFKYGTGSVQNLATNVYNYRSDLIQVKQGKFNSTTFLQTIDYAYKSNGLLSGINQYLGTATAGDLFYEELFYDNYLSGSTAVSRKNGEISNVKWQRRNGTIVGGVHAYTYSEFGELLTNDYYNLTGATTFTSTTKFDETFGFSGKYGKITSQVKKDNTGANIDSLLYSYVANSPRVANVYERSSNILGHNQNGQPTSGNVYSYDLNGNQKNDPYRGVDSIKYNYLDLPDTIFISGGKRVVMTYDAIGNMLTKKVYNTGTILVENRTYINGFEFVAYGTGTQSLEMVHHSQGYYRISTIKHKYTIADHLGNTRIVYTDTNGNGTIEQSEILDENHYYAYGMEMSDPAFLNNSIYKYKFNGIERTESLGLTIDLALYRGLDPVLGKWYQVDPKAEQAGYWMSPYCAMGNNPILNADPDGDLFFAIPQISFNGGFSIGLEVGIGVPGVLSASFTVGGGSGGGYWLAQGYAGGFYAGFGSSGVFAGLGYQYAGFSGGWNYGNGGLSFSIGYGVGGKGLTTFGASGGLSYNLSSGQFGYNVGAAYTHIFEKPTVELQNTYGKTDASTTSVEQRTTHDCLLGACEYIGSESYDDILKKFTEGDDPLYVPGVGTKTLPALQKLYGIVQKLDGVNHGISDSYWKKGGNVLVAQNSNHAVVLNKISEFKLTYQYRRNNTQIRHKYTYMNPATGSFQTTGFRRNYNYPTYYFFNN